MRDLKPKDKAAIVGFLILTLTVINYGAHLWSGNKHFEQFDVVFQRLYFLPIILGSFWFALRGGLVVWLITSVSLIPYLIIHWEGLSSSDLDRILLVIAFLVMAAVLGKAVLMQRIEHKRSQQSETLAAIGKSMSAIAHEMRTPLIAIGGFTKMVRKNIPEGSPDAEKLDIVMVEALRLENLLKGVLDFARPLAVNRQSASIEQIVKECLAVTGYIAEQHGIALESRLQPDLPLVCLDAMRIKQVLINLITNAIQASPQGGNVTVGCSLESGKLIVDIIDCGCGIPRQKRKEVFSPFFSTKKEGVGLGLPIVKKIVDAHEGDLRIVDNPKGGLTFRVEIPYCVEDSSFMNDVQSFIPASAADGFSEQGEEIVEDIEKIRAVEKYLKEEFASSTIESSYDPGRKARVFKIITGNSGSTTVIVNEFLKKNSAEAIPGILRTYLLAEHLRECGFPIVVTTSGLTE